jgi:hypothetical protein
VRTVVFVQPNAGTDRVCKENLIVMIAIYEIRDFTSRDSCHIGDHPSTRENIYGDEQQNKAPYMECAGV